MMMAFAKLGVFSLAISAFAGPRIESAIPADRLAKIKAALPAVSYPELEAIFASPSTYWYDHESMTPSYQDSINEPIVGANSNALWFRLLADSLFADGDKIFDRSKSRWQFPFATTFGTDQTDNIQVAEFLALPVKDGRLVPVSIWNPSDGWRSSWNWLYPLGTTIGEVIFLKDGTNLLATEVRVRQRTESGWAANIYRPFPTAPELAKRIQDLRPAWANDARLQTMVQHLNDAPPLRTKRLTAAGFTGTFDHEGAIDDLPDFADPVLVRELLKTTTFTSAYGAIWKQNGQKIAYAASSREALSVVPRSYDAGVVEVSDESCARCHQNTGNLIEKWFPDVVLYGEIWGKDGVFSFHPYDESEYPYGGNENRRMNPKLESQGIVVMGDKPTSADYPATLFGD